MQVKFWSLSRSGFAPVESAATLRQLLAALASARTARPRLHININDGSRRKRFSSITLEFSSRGVPTHTGEPLFRCSFSFTFLHRGGGSLWYRADGGARRFKPSNFDNPVSRYLNKLLLNGTPFEPLSKRERVLLALGF